MRTRNNLFITISLLICMACSGQGESNPDDKNPPKEIKSVKVSPVSATPLRGSLEYVGTLSAHRKVNVATEIGGTIEKLFFEKGDRVKEGDPLVEISTSSYLLQVRKAEAALAMVKSELNKTEKGSRPEEIRIAMAAVEHAEATLSEAGKNFKRIKDLHGYHAVANSEYDSAKRAVETASAALQSSREQLELAKQGPRVEDREAARAGFDQAQSALEIAKDHLSKSRLLSPCEGIIAFRKVEEGEVVGPGTVITQVVDNRRMKINLSVSEKDISLFSKGKTFPFFVDAIPGEEFGCQLIFLSPAAELATRSFPLELSVDEPDSRMADGMTIRVRFPFFDQKKITKVPTAWLWEEDGHMGLFVFEDGKAVFRKTRLGSYYENRVEILSGVSDQDLVITNPAGLKTGDAIKY
ncbi:MAG: efflux RND transporter periplasmic adaptor subunit [Pseudomonadota bacterium]